MLTWFIVGLFYSCDRPEPNCSVYLKNPDLKRFPAETKIHQTILKELMVEHKPDLDFYFAGKHSLHGQDILIVNCYGPDFCVKVKFLLLEEDPFFENLTDNERTRGLPVLGLKWESQIADNGEIQLIYQGMSRFGLLLD